MDRFIKIREILDAYKHDPQGAVDMVRVHIDGSAFSTEAIAIAFHIAGWHPPKSKLEWFCIDALPWGHISGENLYRNYSRFAMAKKRIGFFGTAKGAKVYDELLDLLADDREALKRLNGEYSQRPRKID